jgi:hypothetical protein
LQDFIIMYISVKISITMCTLKQSHLDEKKGNKIWNHDIFKDAIDSVTRHIYKDGNSNI